MNEYIIFYLFIRGELKNKNYNLSILKFRMESLNLKLDDLETVNIDFSDPNPSSNFGSGIELLMNDKAKTSSAATTIDMNDLDDLEKELNDLSTNMNDGPSSSRETKTINNGFSNFFGFASKNNENIKIVTEDTNTSSSVGQATVESIGNHKTWDGYSKMNEVPSNKTYTPSNLSESEKRRKKRTMLRHLDEWYEKGIVKNISHFSMESSFEEIEDEYQGALEDKRRKDAVKLQQNWMITAINTIEYGNAMFNPFDISLDGWGESVSENIDEYSEIFEQLHEKYKGGKMSPELSLLLKLGFSASVVHFSNRAMSTMAPGYADIMKQSPELMRQFTNATVDIMKQSSPGMAFASDLLNNTRGMPSGNMPPPVETRNQSMSTPMTGFPPAPIETRNQPAPQASSRPGMQFTQMPSNRPDINAGRGVMFKERGVEMNSGYQDVNQSSSMPNPPQQSQRMEMSGPKMTDIDNILSGLKTKTINIHEPTPIQSAQPTFAKQNITPMNMEEDSMISISSLKDMQGSAMPKRTNRRKPRSDKNVISLDI